MATIKNHGTVRGYKAGCRCDLCTHANTKAKQRERERKREREGRPAARVRRVPTTPTADPPEPEYGPIEAAARVALAEAGGDDPVAVMRREVVYRAAAVMDNPKHAPFFKSASDVLRATVADLLVAAPPKDGEADALHKLVDSFSSRGRAGRRAPMDDPEESK